MIFNKRQTVRVSSRSTLTSLFPRNDNDNYNNHNNMKMTIIVITELGRAYGAPWVRKCGKLPIQEILVITWPYTDRPPARPPERPSVRPPERPSVRTTGIPMFTLTLSSYFESPGSPGENWLHINVEINWQLSKQGIRWPSSPGRIAGSGADASRSSIFWSYPLTSY